MKVPLTIGDYLSRGAAVYGDRTAVFDEPGTAGSLGTLTYRELERRARGMALALDAIGHVPWWPPERREVTLHRILVHMIAETDRHAGQADIVRELIDGATGLRQDNGSLAPGDRAWWATYRTRLEAAAREAGAR